MDAPTGVTALRTPPPALHGFGDRLRAARLARDLTQTEAARAIGRNLRTYQRYERGELYPPLPTLAGLAEVFDARLIDLLDTSSS
jgi:transcriptional regulator with XRE-family HTH domain